MTIKKKVDDLRTASRSMSEEELTVLEVELERLLSEIKHRLYVKKHTRMQHSNKSNK